MQIVTVSARFFGHIARVRKKLDVQSFIASRQPFPKKQGNLPKSRYIVFDASQNFEHRVSPMSYSKTLKMVVKRKTTSENRGTDICA